MLLIPVHRYSGTASGYGYIAGEPPDGLVQQEGTPVQAVIDLFETDSRLWIRQTMSTHDGKYQFPALPLDRTYFAVARPPDPSFKYVIQELIEPEAY